MKGKEADTTMVQSAVRLPRDLHERLKKAGGERGMGEEIRRRLESSFGPGAFNSVEDADATTANLLDAIGYVAGQVGQFYGPWHKDAFAFAVFKAGVESLLRDGWKDWTPPKAGGEAKPTELAEVIFGEGAHLKSVEEMSRAIVALWRSSQVKN